LERLGLETQQRPMVDDEKSATIRPDAATIAKENSDDHARKGSVRILVGGAPAKANRFGDQKKRSTHFHISNNTIVVNIVFFFLIYLKTIFDDAMYRYKL